MNELHLQPGEHYFGGGRQRIHTLLGSCVAITFWHLEKQLGGMCHYTTPTRGNKQASSLGHYADEVILWFLERIRENHTKPEEYQVKLFGGGTMFLRQKGTHPHFDVAGSNVLTGQELLRRQGFLVQAADVGGGFHRRIYLELWNGSVWLKKQKTFQLGEKPCQSR
ncbi:MAG: hypothetical protein A2600_00970 [Candidatus Lambdaproteobacteria bacterium RIFOXYD1_FULL_56_27]|nr:MAG: hypothetical protein A2426_12920 [Candidatus Lambdaproteobacteria bacterium RIFOXYC1_FULL_56_13]OGH06962.1 MAG: hypothetical protein A2600_00970 [Candidatus Lambdaproteobacteria bacterium RIFOXYD1_FULL_56_27]